MPILLVQDHRRHHRHDLPHSTRRGKRSHPHRGHPPIRGRPRPQVLHTARQCLQIVHRQRLSLLHDRVRVLPVLCCGGDRRACRSLRRLRRAGVRLGQSCRPHPLHHLGAAHFSNSCGGADHGGGRHGHDARLHQDIFPIVLDTNHRRDKRA